MNQISEEKLCAIIQSRLSLRDSQLKRFVAKSLEFLNNFDKVPAETAELLYKESLSELENLEFQVLKAEMSHLIRIRDLQTYRDSRSSVQSEIAVKRAEIDELKASLKLETAKKRFRGECEIMAREIVEYEDRSVLMEKVEGVQEEIRKLEENYNENVASIENKEKELYLIVMFINGGF